MAKNNCYICDVLADESKKFLVQGAITPPFQSAKTIGGVPFLTKNMTNKQNYGR